MSVLVPHDGRDHRLTEAQAEETYLVPHSTIDRHINKLPPSFRNNPHVTKEKVLERFQAQRIQARANDHDLKALLSVAEEAELHLWIKTMERVCHSVPPHVVKEKIRQMLGAGGNSDMKIGKNYITRLIKSWPDLSLRTSTSITNAKYSAVTRESINAWFQLAGPIITRLSAEQIYAGDEAGLKGDEVEGIKVLATRGAANVNLTGGTSTDHTTVLHIGNAKGESLPPVIVIKGDKMHPDMYKGAIPNTLIGTSESGFFNQKLFISVIKFFIENTSRERECLLIIDGAEAHISLEAMKICQANKVMILFLPSHHSHILQVDDVGVFSSFKSHWKTFWEEHHRQHPNLHVNKYNIVSFIAEVWPHAMTKTNIVSGFRHTGTWPFDPSKITDDKLYGSSTSLSSHQLEQLVTSTATSTSRPDTPSDDDEKTRPKRAKRRRMDIEREVIDDVTSHIENTVTVFAQASTHGMRPTQDDVARWLSSLDKLTQLIVQHDVILNGYNATVMPGEAVTRTLTVPPRSERVRRRTGLVRLDCMAI